MAAASWKLHTDKFTEFSANSVLAATEYME